MTMVAGADGCKGGWICIRKEGRSLSANVYPTADDLIQQLPAPTILAIDIPIGLSSDGSRECDRLARSCLGRVRGSSVFPAPLRPVLSAAAWDDAAQISTRIAGKSISKQTWGILPKIRDVDRILCAEPGLQNRVREVHPEVCFWAWNGDKPMRFRKKSAEGRADRRALVDAYLGPLAFETVREKSLVKNVGTDDILDAFAALWTAERIFRGQARTLPDDVKRDGFGLRMEIVY
jgi:predicted RNase H-like nuclease